MEGCCADAHMVVIIAHPVPSFPTGALLGLSLGIRSPGCKWPLSTCHLMVLPGEQVSESSSELVTFLKSHRGRSPASVG